MGGRFKDALPLKVFVRKKQVLDLYRRLLRAGRRADVALSNGESTDLYDRVRTEFRIHRNMIDSGTISTLITEGLRHAENLESMARTSSGETDDSWMNTGDAHDPRGRVGEEWPWDRS